MGKSLELRTFEAVSSWSSNARTRFTIPWGKQAMPIRVVRSGGQSTVQIAWPEYLAGQAAVAKVAKHSDVGHSYVFSILALTFGLSFIGLAVLRDQLRSYASGAVVALSLLTLTAIYVGTPFGSQAGMIDSGDDKSYVAWSKAIGFNFDANLKHIPYSTWAKTDNHHSWGTGLMLAPGLMLQGLLYPHLKHWNHVSLSVLSAMSVLMSTLGMLLFLRVYRRSFDGWIAVLCALALILGTSMIKWTFLRNVFTHSSELASLGLMALCAWPIWSGKARLVHRLGFAAALVLAIQIRRENAMFALLPIWYEFFGPAAFKTHWKARVARGVGYGAAMFSGLMILNATNLLTNAPGFWYQPTARLLKGVTGDTFFHNLYIVMISEGSGLFAYWQLPSFMALGALVIHARSWRTWLPLTAHVGGTLLMCCLHQYPTGVEWQNRFFIKISPIIMLGAGFFISWRSNHWWRGAMGMLLAGFCYYETFGLFRPQIPYGLPFYADLFTDRQMLEPQMLFDRTVMLLAPLGLILLSAIMLVGCYRGIQPRLQRNAKRLRTLAAWALLVVLVFNGSKQLAREHKDYGTAIPGFYLRDHHHQLRITPVGDETGSTKVRTCYFGEPTTVRVRLSNHSKYPIASDLPITPHDAPFFVSAYWKNLSTARQRIWLPHSLMPQLGDKPSTMELSLVVTCPSANVHEGIQVLVIDGVQEGRGWMHEFAEIPELRFLVLPKNQMAISPLDRGINQK